MPITKTQGYKASDGVVYATVEEAQRAELAHLFEASEPWQPEEVALAVVQHADAIISILTTGPRSRPKARKAAGTTNPKRAVKRATPEQAAAGFAGMRRAAAAAPATEAPELEPCDTAAYVTNGSD